MIPAKSTSDQRTYSSMICGWAAMRSPRGCGSGEARRRAPEPLDARRGADAPVAGAQPVRLEAPPQRGPADAEPPGRLGEPAARASQRVDDGLALSLRQCARLLGLRQEYRLAQARCTRAQRRD